MLVSMPRRPFGGGGSRALPPSSLLLIAAVIHSPPAAAAAAAADNLQACQAAADAFCNTAASGDGVNPCAHFQPSSCSSDSFIARLARGSPAKNQLPLQWRCIASSVEANASNTNYATACYCTKHEQLLQILTECLQRAAPATLVFSSSKPPLPPIAGTPKYGMVRIPALLETTQRTLLAFGTARRSSGGGGSDYGWNDILLRRSTDEGKSWGKVQLVWGESKPATIDNPCPIWDNQRNRTVFLFMRNGKAMFITTSKDDGQTWSAPRNITAQAMRDPALPGNKNWRLVYTGPPGGIQMQRGAYKGRLICPCHHAETNNAHGVQGTDASYSVYSDDGGETWSIGADVTRPAFSGENQLAELPDGTLLTAIRENGAWDGSYGVNRTTMLARSTDGGATWGATYSPKTKFPETNCEGSLVAQPNSVDGPRLLRSGILGGGIGAKEKRTGMVVRQSSDFGDHWTDTVVWADYADYSSLQALRNGKIALLYTRNASLETVFQLLPGI